jgi:hypothetical protein
VTDRRAAAEAPDREEHSAEPGPSP